MARRQKESIVERELTEEERLEAELAESARRGADDWGPPPGKAKALLPTLRRMLGLLAPFKALLAIVFVVGSTGIVLNVIAPRVLAEGTNLIVQGLVQQMLGAQGVPSGTSQSDVVALLRQQGQDDFANIIANMDGFTVGAGIDFGALSQVLMLVLALYVVASLFQWVQGYFVNRVVQRTVAGLRAAVEETAYSAMNSSVLCAPVTMPRLETSP